MSTATDLHASAAKLCDTLPALPLDLKRIVVQRIRSIQYSEQNRWPRSDLWKHTKPGSWASPSVAVLRFVLECQGTYTTVFTHQLSATPCDQETIWSS